MIPKIESSQRRFPWDIFDPELYQNFRDIANANSLPLDYLGTQAIFTIAALAGNQYVADVNGGIKPIVFIAKIGPSGVGKTPAYNKVCGDIINPLRVKADIEWEQRYRDWKARRQQCQAAKIEFDEPEPAKIKRMIESGTVESFAKHMLTSHAGFGVLYDEGERFFGESNKYNKAGGNDTGFWNEVFNGKPMDITRVDAERERFIKWPAISVDIGLQTERLAQYFNMDTMDSGLLNRFLLVESDYVVLNEQVDAWSQKLRPHPSWVKLVSYLFEKGFDYEPGKAQLVEFTDNAKLLSNRIYNQMTKKSNEIISLIRDGEPTRYIAAYRSKLSQYFYRFALISAIYKDPGRPVIDEWCVSCANKLVEYYETTARKVINRLHLLNQSNLTESELSLFEELPAFEFTAEIAKATCKSLGLSESLFGNALQRKFIKYGLIKRVKHGTYQKQI